MCRFNASVNSNHRLLLCFIWYTKSCTKLLCFNLPIKNKSITRYSHCERITQALGIL